ncbi:MAG TPA: BamA/TamA family outer membrane protein [Gemmatimonadales bacterium]|nr:BamA/TamA family outer membrane protein [Gemmatimonadales bacterium]
MVGANPLTGGEYYVAGSDHAAQEGTRPAMPDLARLSRAAALALAGSAAAPSAQGQYFGRNKVQYETYEFKVLRTEHFDVHFYPRERAAAELAARAAERWYARLSRLFRHELRGRQPLILYASPSEFRQTNAIPGELGEGTGGVTEAFKRRIVMPIGGPLEEMDHVLGHELVHAFQYDITGQGGLAVQGLPAAGTLPLWFIEGMAEYLSLGPAHSLTAMWLRDAARHRFPRYRDLDDPRYFPYRFGHAFLAYIAGNWGDEVLATLLRAAARRRDVGPAIAEVLGFDPDSLAERWEEATRTAFAAVAAHTRPAEAEGVAVIRPGGDEQTLYNLSPSVSPDGRWLMFLSDRGLFSIDLFLADLRTGRVVRQVTETAVDPHYSSLQFLTSAGAWSRDGRRFAFAGIAGGDPVLSVYAVESGRVEREIRLPQLGEAYHPSWSPDGRRLAFVGLDGGFLDLFVYDLDTGRLARLTADPYTDLQPAWSPDGRTIAFASDRFTTSLELMAPGPTQITLIDPADRRIRPALPTEWRGRQLNPQWSPDGSSLYFIGEPDGIPNVYRLGVADGDVAPVTDLYTGTSGITPASPALSVAQRSGEVVVSVYEKGGYWIYRLEPGEATAAYREDRPPADAGLLPPHHRPTDGYLALLRDPTFGLPPAGGFEVRPYRARLSLDYVAQPTLAAGVDRFGTYIGGGAALFFSDMLGNHNLVAGAQVNGGLADLTALVGYQNLTRRLDWSVVAQQVPILTGAYAAGPAIIGGDTVFAEQELIERQTNRQVGVVLSYPFSRARRMDLSVSFLNIGFDRELRTRAFSLRDGRQVLDEERELDRPEGLDLGQGSAALVYDASVFGATSPIAGQRYRLEVAPTVGSLTIVEALADYRRYFVPFRPFTLAIRTLHYGRYGSGADDDRLSPLFLGHVGLVRGYGFRSFDPGECEPPPDDPAACPVFDQLLGTRILVGNAELRFPLLGLLGVGGGYYGALPLELAIFADGGVAWDQETAPALFGGRRDLIGSAGVAARLNLFGFAIAQVDAAHPFDRPGKGWVWQVSLQPGF